MNSPTNTETERYWVLVQDQKCLCCGREFEPPLESTIVRINNK